MSALQTEIHRQVEACKKGDFERLIGRARSGFIIMGASQVLRGYCLLLPHDVPAHLNALALNDRILFLQEMSQVGESIMKVVGAVRMNYEMLGNLEPALHAHIIPRFHDEPSELKTLPYWKYPDKLIQDFQFSIEKDSELMNQIRAQLIKDGLIDRH